MPDQTFDISDLQLLKKVMIEEIEAIEDTLKAAKSTIVHSANSMNDLPDYFFVSYKLNSITKLASKLFSTLPTEYSG